MGPLGVPAIVVQVFWDDFLGEAGSKNLAKCASMMNVLVFCKIGEQASAAGAHDTDDVR